MPPSLIYWLRPKPATGDWPMARPLPSSGAISADVHVVAVRVYYEDTDAAGMVYHANYLRFAERARTEMLRLFGTGQAELRAREGLGFTVRRCQMDFLKPARLDDALEVHTRVLAARGARVEA